MRAGSDCSDGTPWCRPALRERVTAASIPSYDCELWLFTEPCRGGRRFSIRE